MLNFCTLFDKNYLAKGMMLFESLKLHCENFHLFILCLDDYTYDYWKQNNAKQLTLIRLSDLEDFNSELFIAKQNRTLVEYYFTLSPCLPLFLLKKYSNLPWICSVDSDIYFYGNPKSIFDDFEKNHSILITPHKFTPELTSLNFEKYGIFNVSFQAFKNNDIGLACLEKWQKQCILWCKYKYDSLNERYADQKYLDTWESDFPNSIKILDDDVTGLAVWNINNYFLSTKGTNLMSNGKRIVFYHFHCLHLINKHWFETGFSIYNVRKSKLLDQHIYQPYINQLYKFEDKHDKALNNYAIIKKDMIFRILGNKKLFYRLNNNLIFRVNTFFILNTYVFIKSFLKTMFK